MNLDLKKQGKSEVSLDFYDRKNRRRSHPQINYCELDPEDMKKVTNKGKSPEEPMLSFEAYWKIIAEEKSNSSKTVPTTSELPALGSTDTPNFVSTETPTLGSTDTPNVSTTLSVPPRRIHSIGTMDLDAIENNIEDHERKRKLKRKLAKRKAQMENQNEIDPTKPASGDPSQPSEASPTPLSETTQNQTETKKSPKKMTTQNPTQTNKSPKKRLRGSTQQSPKKKKKMDKPKNVAAEPVNPVKVVIPENLKQLTLFAFFKKVEKQ